MGFEAPINIAQAMESVHQRRYVLPAIQREFVWSTGQIEQLFDSIMRGYPIGSFLFWQVDHEHQDEYQFYDFIRDYNERDRTHNEPASMAGFVGVTAILDGQQRLTSLYIGMHGSYAYKTKWKSPKAPDAYPKRRLYLDLLEDDDDWDAGYRFRFLTESEAAADDVRWYSVGDVLKAQGMADLNKQLAQRGLTSVDHANDALFKLFQMIRVENLINYYRETSQDLDKVLNIFIRVNSGGTTLSYSDLLLSVATAQWQTRDARQAIVMLVDDLNQRGEGFRFERDFVLKAALVLADIGSVQFKVTNFTRANMDRIEAAWDRIAESLQVAVELAASFGLNGSTLTSNNALIPIAYYLSDRQIGDEFLSAERYRSDRAEVRRWLLTTLLKGTFGGQADTVQAAIRTEIANSEGGYPFRAIATRLAGMFKSLVFSSEEIDALADNRYGTRQTAQVLALLYPGIDYRTGYHFDHLHPRSRFRGRALTAYGLSPEEGEWVAAHIDDLANLSALQPLENITKADRPLKEWLDGMPVADRDGVMLRHRIPIDVSLEPAAFRAFHASRRAEIVRALTILLGEQESAPDVAVVASSEPSPAPALADVDPSADADQMLSRVRAVLIEAAQQRLVVSYGQLGARVGLDLDDPPARNALSELLGRISQQEVAEGRPMLSSLVVQAESQAPGSGFISLAQLLGVAKPGDDPDVVAFRQMEATWQAWSPEGMRG